MITAQLLDVRMHGYHGIFPGEEVTGSPYTINLEVTYDETLRDLTDINTLVSYADLFDIVKQRMHIRTGLLEEVCEQVILEVRNKYPFATAVTISIEKMDPPIPNFNGKAGVRMTKMFNV